MKEKIIEVLARKCGMYPNQDGSVLMINLDKAGNELEKLFSDQSLREILEKKIDELDFKAKSLNWEKGKDLVKPMPYQILRARYGGARDYLKQTLEYYNYEQLKKLEDKVKTFNDDTEFPWTCDAAI